MSETDVEYPEDQDQEPTPESPEDIPEDEEEDKSVVPPDESS